MININSITVDTKELSEDLELIASGVLSLPTVSAIKIGDEEIPIFLESEDDL